MQYKLLKDLPGIKAGEIISELQDTYPYSVKYKTVSGVFANAHPDFFEPLEKKRYEDLKEVDEVWYIFNDKGVDWDYFSKGDLCSEVFLTREEAEDEYKRREWAVRPDKFIPKLRGWYYYWNAFDKIIRSKNNMEGGFDIMTINAGLAFRTPEDCEKAMKEHDLVRLFYTIRA